MIMMILRSLVAFRAVLDLIFEFLQELEPDFEFKSCRNRNLIYLTYS
jgi:hypothetical protein